MPLPSYAFAPSFSFLGKVQNLLPLPLLLCTTTLHLCGPWACLPVPDFHGFLCWHRNVFAAFLVESSAALPVVIVALEFPVLWCKILFSSCFIVLYCSCGSENILEIIYNKSTSVKLQASNSILVALTCTLHRQVRCVTYRRTLPLYSVIRRGDRLSYVCSISSDVPSLDKWASSLTLYWSHKIPNIFNFSM